MDRTDLLLILSCLKYLVEVEDDRNPVTSLMRNRLENRIRNLTAGIDPIDRDLTAEPIRH